MLTQKEIEKGRVQRLAVEKRGRLARKEGRLGAKKGTLTGARTQLSSQLENTQHSLMA
jgi:hypothetical protein